MSLFLDMWQAQTNPMKATPAIATSSHSRSLSAAFGGGLRGAFAAGWFALAVYQPALAAERTPEWFEHTQENAWLQHYDPTLVSRRVLAEFSYESDDHEDIWKIEHSLRWGVPLRKDLASGLQALVPVKWIDSPSGGDSGFGDLELRTGLVGRISPALRYGFGLNAEFDTASDSALGANALVLRPTTAIRWDAGDRINLGLNIEYNFTPLNAGDDTVSALELKFPVILKLTDAWSAAATYKPRWNFLNDSDRHRLELGGTRLLGAGKHYAFSFSLEIPLSPESFDYKLLSGLTWYF